MIGSDGTMSIEQAARACRVSDETIRRRLRADALPGAFRRAPAGAWRIPVAALLAAGFELDVRAEDGAAERDAKLREALARVEAAERVAEERLARIAQLERHVEDLRTALQLLEGRR